MHDVLDAAKVAVTAHVPVMTLADIRKSFGPVQALKGVDVLIMPGEVHAIVGENGAGKSTLIGIAAGVLRADSGAIYYGGKYVSAPAPRQMREDGVVGRVSASGLGARSDGAGKSPACGAVAGRRRRRRRGRAPLGADRDRRAAHAGQQARRRIVAGAAARGGDRPGARHPSESSLPRRADRAVAARRRAQAVRPHRRIEARRRRHRLRLASAA